MTVLIHTCGAEAFVAIAEEGRVLRQEVLPGREASEKLVPALGRLLAGVQAPVRTVGVVHGPGSFTGVRVGLSAAKGLCEARSASLVAISRLALVAAEAPGALAVLDAGRGEFYCRLPDGRELICTRAELLGLLRGERVVTSEVRVQQSLLAEVEVQAIAEPGAGALLALVGERVRVGGFSDVATVDANYLRRTDAELLAAKLR